MKKTAFYILAIILISAIPYLAGCGSSESSSEKTDTNLTTQQPTAERFTLRNIYGKNYRWSDFVGKPFMINFWATWCGPCRAEIPGMIKVYADYKPKGLEIVAISLDDARTKSRVVPFIDQYMIPWVVLYGDQAVSDEFQAGTSIPVTIFFDANGNETARLLGARPESDFRRELDKLFNPPDQI